VVSQLRAYTFDELSGLDDDAAPDSYEWTAGRIALPSFPGHLTYLIGYPR